MSERDVDIVLLEADLRGLIHVPGLEPTDRDRAWARVIRLGALAKQARDERDAARQEVRQSDRVLREQLLRAEATPPALTLTAEEAWERDQDAVARAHHADWKHWIVGQEYADHSWNSKTIQGPEGDPSTDVCADCHRKYERHHPDMVPYDDLPEEKRGKYLAKAAYLLGFEAGARSTGER